MAFQINSKNDDIISYFCYFIKLQQFRRFLCFWAFHSFLMSSTQRLPGWYLKIVKMEKESFVFYWIDWSFHGKWHHYLIHEKWLLSFQFKIKKNISFSIGSIQIYRYQTIKHFEKIVFIVLNLNISKNAFTILIWKKFFRKWFHIVLQNELEEWIEYLFVKSVKKMKTFNSSRISSFNNQYLELLNTFNVLITFDTNWGNKLFFSEKFSL